MPTFRPTDKGWRTTQPSRSAKAYKWPSTRARRAFADRRIIRPVLLPNAIGHSPSLRLLRIQSAPISSRSRFPGALQKVAKKTYIRLPKFPQPPFDKALADCKTDKSWTTFELPDIGHMGMLDAPDRVTQLILQGA